MCVQDDGRGGDDDSNDNDDDDDDDDDSGGHLHHHITGHRRVLHKLPGMSLPLSCSILPPVPSPPHGP